MLETEGGGRRGTQGDTKRGKKWEQDQLNARLSLTLRYLPSIHPSINTSFQLWSATGNPLLPAPYRLGYNPQGAVAPAGRSEGGHFEKDIFCVWFQINFISVRSSPPRSQSGFAGMEDGGVPKPSETLRCAVIGSGGRAPRRRADPQRGFLTSQTALWSNTSSAQNWLQRRNG